MGFALGGAGVTIAGCGRLPSWICHLPLGCIGVSSYPTGACWPSIVPASQNAITICAITRVNTLMVPPETQLQYEVYQRGNLDFQNSHDRS